MNTTASIPKIDVTELFGLIRQLSPLRVIQISGPSVFETICELDSFSIADGWFNAITPQYHWHLALEQFQQITTRDTIHERSGRRVLFFELRQSSNEDPFLLIYLHRGKGQEFESDREEIFERLHGRCSEGALVEIES